VYFSFKSTEEKFRLEMRNDATSFETCIIVTSKTSSNAMWEMYH